jgi:hypothetical protein
VVTCRGRAINRPLCQSICRPSLARTARPPQFRLSQPGLSASITGSAPNAENRRCPIPANDDSEIRRLLWQNACSNLPGFTQRSVHANTCPHPPLARSACVGRCAGAVARWRASDARHSAAADLQRRHARPGDHCLLAVALRRHRAGRLPAPAPDRPHRHRRRQHRPGRGDGARGRRHQHAGRSPPNRPPSTPSPCCWRWRSGSSRATTTWPPASGDRAPASSSATRCRARRSVSSALAASGAASPRFAASPFRCACWPMTPISPSKASPPWA